MDHLRLGGQPSQAKADARQPAVSGDFSVSNIEKRPLPFLPLDHHNRLIGRVRARLPCCFPVRLSLSLCLSLFDESTLNSLMQGKSLPGLCLTHKREMGARPRFAHCLMHSAYSSGGGAGLSDLH